MNNIAKYPLLCPVDGGIIGGIVGGIGSMIGAGINARAQKKMNEQNIKAQQRENQLNREFTEDMYNKYESPAAQRQQMLEAGLNPMGAIAPQSVGSASTSALPPGQAPDFGSAIQEGVQSFFDSSSAILAQSLQKQEIKQKELENWRIAFENGNAEELYEAQLKALNEQTAYTRAQKRAKNQEIKNLQFTYKKAKEAYEKGINEFVDDHNVKESQAAANNASATATTDANKRASELHEYAKKMYDKELDAKELTNAMLADQAVFTMDKSNIRGYLNVNYDDLPQWLRPYALLLYNTHELLKSSDSSSSSYAEAKKCLDEAKHEFSQLVQKYISESSFNNSSRSVAAYNSFLSYASTLSTEDARWARESQQRMYDNIIKGLTVASQIDN